MPRVKAIYNNFTAGELTPLLSSRVDLAKHQNGCKTLENWIILPWGGLIPRWGSRYVKEAKSSATEVRLIPFEYSTEQAYILEFGNLYIRFYKDHGRIGGTITGAADNGAGLIRITSAAHGLTTGDTVYISGVAGTTEANGFWTVTVITVNTFDLQSSAFADAYVSGGTWCAEIVSPYGEDDLAGLKFVQSADVLYLCHPEYPPYKLSRTSHTTWTITEIAFVDGPYLEEQTSPTFNDTATTENITLAASGDLFVAGHVGALWRLKHGTSGAAMYDNAGDPDDSATWGATNCSMARTTNPGGGYGGDNYYYTITESAPYQSASLALSGLTVGTVYKVTVQVKDGTGSCSSASLNAKNNALTGTLATVGMAAAADWTGFQLYWEATETNNQITVDAQLGTGETMLLDAIRVEEVNVAGTSSWGYVTITGVTSATQATATVVSALGASTVATAWREGAWSDYRGFPSCCSFFEQRLFFGKGFMLYGSKSADFENFTPGVLDDDPIVLPVVANQMNAIRWLAGESVLIPGTAGGAFRVTGGSADYLAPTNVDIKPSVRRRSADIDALPIGNAILFVQRGGRKIRELVYSFEVDQYTSPDLTRLSPHVAEGRVKEWAYQDEPYGLVWVVTNDGVLLSLTYLRDEDVVGWARHVTDGLVESLVSIPNPDDDGDEVWLVVKRTIGGVDKRYIEYLDPDILTDCALTYSGAATATVTGVTHLVGETAQIVGDGAVYPSQTVPTGGSLTLSKACAAIEVGLGYTSTLVPWKPEVQIAGTSKGEINRWSQCGVDLYEARGLKINGERLPFRKPSDPMDAATPLFTGEKYIDQIGWSKEGWITIVRDLPLPATVLSFFGNLEVGG